jgi:hypothetical protein
VYGHHTAIRIGLYIYIYIKVRRTDCSVQRIRVHFVRPINNHHQMAHGAAAAAAAAVTIGCFINENNVGCIRVALCVCGACNAIRVMLCGPERFSRVVGSCFPLLY